MSAGVSDQRMKGQGTTQAKNVEERSIPWSQQVDEASYENLSSPTEGNQSGSSGGGTQFQFPPFNPKDGTPAPPIQNYQSGGFNSSRRNYQNDGYGQQQFSSYNNYSRNGGGEYNNSWNSKHQMNSNQNYNNRRTNYYEENNYRSDRNNHHGNDGFKQSLQRGVQNLLIDKNDSSRSANNKLNSNYSNPPSNNNSGNDNKPPVTTTQQTSDTNQQTASASKKMTWASIASQPAKPTLRTSSTSSTLKKKGPGMPPPPMVPGKHNMDIGTWDTPAKNGPILVPPPPPPVIPVPIMEQQSNQSNKSGSLSSNQQKNQQQQNNQKQRDNGSGHQEHDISRNSNQIAHQTQKSYERNNHQQQISHQNLQSTKPSGDIKPPWVPQQHQNQHPQHHQSQYQHNQQAPPPHHYQNNSRNITTNSYHRPNNPNYQRQDSQEGSNSSGPGASVGRSVGYPPHANQQLPYKNQANAQGDGPLTVTDSSGNNSQHQQHSKHPMQSNSYSPLITSPTTNNTINLPILDEILDRNNYNPAEIDFQKANLARYFVIKSYAEDDVHRSIKYGIWCSTDHGNERLDKAFKEREKENGYIYLFFSVNGSGHFCGMAQMLTRVDYNSNSNVWAQNKWKGSFRVKWIYVKDVPNAELRHIRIPSNENKPVTNSRDTQEVPTTNGIQVLEKIHSFKSVTSLFDDFPHYEKRQNEGKTFKNHDAPADHDHYDNNYSIGERDNGAGGNNRSYRSTGGGGGGGGSGDYDRGGYDNKGSFNYGGGYRDRKNYSRSGGYHNFDNRRNNTEDYKSRSGSGFDRNQRNIDNKDAGDSGNDSGHYNNNGGDFHNNRGSFQKSGDYNNRGFHNRERDRDRDSYHDNYGAQPPYSGGFMNRADNRPTGGSFRDNYNRKGNWRRSSTQQNFENEEAVDN